MKQLIKVILIIFILAMTLSCAQQNKIREIIQSIPVFHLENYPGFTPESALIDRLVPAPDFILSYLNTMDTTDRYINYSPTKSERAMLKEYLDLLPREFKKILKARLVGIYLIENFTGSGMADFVLDNNDTVYCNLYINPETMKTDITTWMSFRENSCFIIEGPGNFVLQECGTAYTGLFYVLFHETCHIVDYVCSITPYVDEYTREILGQKSNPTEFTRGIWKSYDLPLRENDSEVRKQITFYGFNNGPKINIRDGEMIYSWLEKTPYTSLYGSQSWAEDWSEWVTWYYFTEVFHQPYKLQLYKNDKLVRTCEPMKSEKVKKRMRMVQKILPSIGENMHSDR